MRNKNLLSDISEGGKVKKGQDTCNRMRRQEVKIIVRIYKQKIERQKIVSYRTKRVSLLARTPEICEALPISWLNSTVITRLSDFITSRSQINPRIET
jgi:ribosomal protein S18